MKGLVNSAYNLYIQFNNYIEKSMKGLVNSAYNLYIQFNDYI